MALVLSSFPILVKYYQADYFQLVVGNVREKSLAEIYRESPVLKELRNPDNYKGKCGVCEYQ